MPDQFNPAEMIERFAERAAAVRKRNLPAVGGEERRLFIQQAETDYMDFAIIADAEATLEEGVLTLRVDLRPTPPADTDDPEPASEPSSDPD